MCGFCQMFFKRFIIVAHDLRKRKSWRVDNNVKLNYLTKT